LWIWKELGGFHCLHQCCGSKIFVTDLDPDQTVQRVSDLEPNPIFKNYEIHPFFDGLNNVSDLDLDAKPRVTDPVKSFGSFRIRINNTGL
jgi:hypothetical protein